LDTVIKCLVHVPGSKPVRSSASRHQPITRTWRCSTVSKTSRTSLSDSDIMELHRWIRSSFAEQPWKLKGFSLCSESWHDSTHSLAQPLRLGCLRCSPVECGLAAASSGAGTKHRMIQVHRTTSCLRSPPNKFCLTGLNLSDCYGLNCAFRSLIHPPIIHCGYCISIYPPDRLCR
jgi:hypothetical protein